MTFNEAVALLGQSEAARIAKVKRTALIYWLNAKVPEWRAIEARRVIRAAERKQAKVAA